MRIATLNWTGSQVGGAETYLDSVICQFERLGFPVAFVSEVEGPAGVPPIAVPRDSASWCVAKLGADRVLDRLRRWKPDLLYCHGLKSTDFEAEALRLAPAIFFAHSYYGTCISGVKTWQSPSARTCSKKFGWRCMLHYYPHRCGGLNPWIGLNEYWRQRTRVQMLHEYRAVIVASEHMRREYLRQGFESTRVHTVQYPVSFAGADHQEQRFQAYSRGANRTDSGLKLLFVGRMHALKGGDLLLKALPLVNRQLRRPVRLVFAGDGPERTSWQELARQVETANPNVKTEFTGWLDRRALGHLFESSDLLIVPSLWPEPFGLVGPEAGLHGTPAVAFAVGGISEWLTDGVNGHLALGEPPSPNVLADAIVRCVKDPAVYKRLCEGAIILGKRFSMERHIASLMGLFATTAGKSLTNGKGHLEAARSQVNGTTHPRHLAT